MGEDEKKEEGFSVNKASQGEVVGGLALVGAVGILLSGYGEQLFSGPLNVANISSTLISLVVILGASDFLFLIGAEIYKTVLKRLYFLKNPYLKGIVLALLMGLVAWLLQVWFGSRMS